MKKIVANGVLYGMILPHDEHFTGTTFFSSEDQPLQIAGMQHAAGHVIPAHRHNRIERKISETQEILMIRRGCLQVDFYDDRQQIVAKEVVSEGDILCLCSGGHGFKVLQELEMVEIKQGPYLGTLDKIRFQESKK